MYTPGKASQWFRSDGKTIAHAVVKRSCRPRHWELPEPKKRLNHFILVDQRVQKQPYFRYNALNWTYFQWCADVLIFILLRHRPVSSWGDIQRRCWHFRDNWRIKSDNNQTSMMFFLVFFLFILNFWPFIVLSYSIWLLSHDPRNISQGFSLIYSRVFLDWYDRIFLEGACAHFSRADVGLPCGIVYFLVNSQIMASFLTS